MVAGNEKTFGKILECVIMGGWRTRSFGEKRAKK